MKNEIRFTLELKQRPKLAQEIGNILGTVPHYERVPSCAYDIAGLPTGQRGCTAYPGGNRKRNSGRPDSAVTGAWVSERCGSNGSNGRGASAAGETDNSDSEREPYGYGIGKFTEDHSK